MKLKINTVGAGRQHAGITGQIENCQTVVTAAYVTGRGHAPYDFRLYLPRAWCEDEQRRTRAQIPASISFKTKTELADGIITGAISGGTPFGWVAADEVYGRASRLRKACEDGGKGYVLAVPVRFMVTLPSGRRAAVSSLPSLVPARCWETRSCGRGCKGHRDWQWAWVATTSPRHWVLIRRSPAAKSNGEPELAFFYCHAPAGRPVSLPVLLKVAGQRWPVEECHQHGKGQTGLDQHQLRLWHSFHRHTVLSMCALALLAAATARPAAGEDIPDSQPAAWHDTGRLPVSADQPPPPDPGMVKVSIPEARRLLRLAAAPLTRPARSPGYAWSRWRRKHQARARWHHHQTRLRATRGP